MFKKLFGIICCDKCGLDVPLDLSKVYSHGECICNECRSNK